MDYIQAIFEALESLSANKMRSTLTVLGVVIGVAAVIAMLAIGNGAQNSITGSIEGIGTNLLSITRTRSTDIRNPKPLTLKDAQAIADPLQAPAVARVAPLVQGSLELSYEGKTTSTGVSGVTPEYAQVRNVEIAEGEFISQGQNLGRSSVVVLGPDTAETLFGRSEGVVGETIRIAGQPFRVIGVLKSKGGSSFGNQDDLALVPLASAQARLLRRSTADTVDSIQVQAADAGSVAQATDQIAQILRAHHRTAVGSDDFEILIAAILPGHRPDHHRRVHHFPGRHCGDFFAGRRHRHHEHHAGLGHRANARDRFAQGIGGAPAGYSDPVPGRIDGAQPARRGHRHPAGLAHLHCRGEHRGGQQYAHQPGGQPEYRAVGDPVFDLRRPVLRHLPRQPGRRPGAGGGATL